MEGGGGGRVLGLGGRGAARRAACPVGARGTIPHAHYHPHPSPQGYAGDFVREYVDATVPALAVGEYWDTCGYTDGVLDYNQARRG